MVVMQLIYNVIEWERRLEFEEERRRSHRSEPYANYLAPLKPKNHLTPRLECRGATFNLHYRDDHAIMDRGSH